MVTGAERGYYDSRFVRPPLIQDVEPHDSRKPPLCTTVDGQEWWTDGRERYSKEGLIYCAFSPWELHVDMLDGQELQVQPAQKLHFLASGLAPETLETMPRCQVLHSNIEIAEVVSVGAVTDGVLVGAGVGVGDDEAPMLRSVYSSTLGRIYINSHSSLLLKRHQVGTQAFSFHLRQNVEILSCDYFSQRVQVQLRSTPANRKEHASLVSLCLHFRANS
jgi:hypothetical protein